VAEGQSGFIRASHSEAGLALQYKLYVPPAHQGKNLPLVVMLHGCFQDADDFAAGTGMNQRAKEQGFFVLYPEQARTDNPSLCWNWFDPAHQQRALGEPAVLAGMVNDVLHTYPINPLQIFVAGMSAGAAMAMVMGNRYPELFAAVAAHSGLAYGAAHNLEQALDLMASGELSSSDQVPMLAHSVPTHPAPLRRKHMPLIVFQGDHDRVVHPRNATQVIHTALLHNHCRCHSETGLVTNDRSFTLERYRDHHGRLQLEYWLIHDLGHAWSGGSPTGSYTDRHGPSASDEMLRFFFAQMR
jgi:poly(hydroxyalkanoate) depolymerase family esterase